MSIDWSSVTGFISNELNNLGFGHLDPAQPPPPDQPPPTPQPDPWGDLVRGAVNAGTSALDYAGRPANMVRSAAVQAANDVGQDVQDQGFPALANDVGSPGALLQTFTRPDVGQAALEGLQGTRQTDPTQLPGINQLPDEGPSIGPVHITPRTVAGFGAGMALDPLMWATGGLEGLAEHTGQGALGTIARGANTAAQLGWHGAGAVQGAELVGTNPDTGEIDPNRALLGAAAGLAAPYALRAAGAGLHALPGVVNAGLEGLDRVSPPETAYASTGDYTPDLFGGAGIDTGGVFDVSPEENRRRAAQEMRRAGAPDLFDAINQAESSGSSTAEQAALNGQAEGSTPSPSTSLDVAGGRGSDLTSDNQTLGVDAKGRPWTTFQNSAGTWGLTYQDAKGNWRMEQYGRTYPTRDAAIQQFETNWKAPSDASEQTFDASGNPTGAETSEGAAPGEPIDQSKLEQEGAYWRLTNWDGSNGPLFRKKGDAQRALMQQQGAAGDAWYQWDVARRMPQIGDSLRVESVAGAHFAVDSDPAEWEDLDYQPDWRMIRIPTSLPEDVQNQAASWLEGNDHDVVNLADGGVAAIFPPDNGEWNSSDDTLKYLVDTAIQSHAGAGVDWPQKFANGTPTVEGPESVPPSANPDFIESNGLNYDPETGGFSLREDQQPTPAPGESNRLTRIIYDRQENRWYAANDGPTGSPGSMRVPLDPEDTRGFDNPANVLTAWQQIPRDSILEKYNERIGAPEAEPMPHTPPDWESIQNAKVATGGGAPPEAPDITADVQSLQQLAQTAVEKISDYRDNPIDKGTLGTKQPALRAIKDLYDALPSVGLHHFKRLPDGLNPENARMWMDRIREIDGASRELHTGPLKIGDQLRVRMAPGNAGLPTKSRMLSGLDGITRGWDGRRAEVVGFGDSVGRHAGRDKGIVHVRANIGQGRTNVRAINRANIAEVLSPRGVSRDQLPMVERPANVTEKPEPVRERSVSQAPSEAPAAREIQEWQKLRVTNGPLKGQIVTAHRNIDTGQVIERDPEGRGPKYDTVNVRTGKRRETEQGVWLSDVEPVEAAENAGVVKTAVKQESASKFPYGPQGQRPITGDDYPPTIDPESKQGDAYRRGWIRAQQGLTLLDALNDEFATRQNRPYVQRGYNAAIAAFERESKPAGAAPSTSGFRIEEPLTGANLTTEPKPEPFHLQPKKSEYPKGSVIKPGYGERRVERERANAGMFADEPGWVDTAENYQSGLESKNAEFNRNMRQSAADGWRRVRAWLDQATPEQVEAFKKKWSYLPHSTEYALDAIRGITGEAAPELAPRATQSTPLPGITAVREPVQRSTPLPGITAVRGMHAALPDLQPTLENALAGFDAHAAKVGERVHTGILSPIGQRLRERGIPEGVVELKLGSDHLTPEAEQSIERVRQALEARGVAQVDRRDFVGRRTGDNHVVLEYGLRAEEHEGLPPGWKLQPDHYDGWSLVPPPGSGIKLTDWMGYGTRFHGDDIHGISEAIDVANRIANGTYTPKVTDSQGNTYDRRNIEGTARWVLAHGAERDRVGMADQYRKVLRDRAIQEQLPEHLRALPPAKTTNGAKPPKPPRPTKNGATPEPEPELPPKQAHPNFPAPLSEEDQAFIRGQQRQEDARNGVGPVVTASPPDDPSRQYRFRLRVVPLDELVPSNTDTGAINPDYPQALQPRDRTRAESQLQIQRIGSDLDNDFLLRDTGMLDRGPMIVGPDRVVESGNGRVLALRWARQNNPEQFDLYQQRLRAEAERLGMDPSTLPPDGVLVRERLDQLTPEDRVQFAAQGNQSAVMQMSPFERAVQEGAALPHDLITTLDVAPEQSIDQALQRISNKPLVDAFLRSIPDNERAALSDSRGNLSQAGLERIKLALFARTYPGEAGRDLLETFSESLDPGLRNVQQALMQSLPTMARANALVASGERTAELSITEDIAKAAHALARLREERIPVQQYLGQQTLGERELTPFQEGLLGDLDQLARKPAQMRTFFEGLAQAIIDSPHADQRVDLFGNPVQITKEKQILDQARRYLQREYPDSPGLFGPQPVAATDESEANTSGAGVPVPPGAGERSNGAAPAGSEGLGASPDAGRLDGVADGQRVNGTGVLGSPAPTNIAELAKYAQEAPSEYPPPGATEVAAEEPSDPLVAPFDKPMAIARSPYTRPSFLEPDELAHVSNLHDAGLIDGAQAFGVSKALAAMNGRAAGSQGGFLLLDGMGVGKSRQQLAIADYYAKQGRAVLIVTPGKVLGDSGTYWKDRDAWGGSFRDDARALGIDGNVSLLKGGEPAEPGRIYLTTYTKLQEANGTRTRAAEPFQLPDGYVSIFDESHNLGNPDSTQSRYARRLIDGSHAVLFASATPFDTAEKWPYLERAGVYEPDLFHDRGEAFEDLGMTRVPNSNPPRYVAGNAITFNSRLEKKYDRLTDKGLMLRREFGFSGVKIGTRDFLLPNEHAGDFQAIQDAFEPRGMVGQAQIVNRQRELLEYHKIPAAVRMTQEATADPDRQVVLFVSNVNPVPVKVRFALKDEEGKVVRNDGAEPVKWRDPLDGQVYLIQPGEAMIHHTEPVMMPSLADYVIPSVADTLHARLVDAGIPDEQIVHIHGGYNGAESMEAFQNARARVVIATMKSGGTGINLDDRPLGDESFGEHPRPRSMLVLTPGWTGEENVQAAGRVWRKPTQSYPGISFLRATNVHVEDHIYNIVAQKFATLGAAVSGDMVRQLGPAEMAQYLQHPDVQGGVDALRVPTHEDVYPGRMLTLRRDGSQVKVIRKTRPETRGGQSPSAMVEDVRGNRAWFKFTDLGIPAGDDVNAANAGPQHKPIAPAAIRTSMKLWDTQTNQPVVVQRIAEGSGRLSGLSNGTLYEPRRYVMVRPDTRGVANAEVRFAEDLRSLEMEEPPAVPEPAAPHAIDETAPPAQTPATPAPTPPTVAPPPTAVPAPPIAELPTADDGGAATTAPTPPSASVGAPGSAPVATPPPPTVAAPTSPASPVPSPPAPPAGGPPAPPTPPPGLPGMPPVPPTPTPPTPPGTELERVHAMWDRQHATTPLLQRAQAAVRPFIDEVERQFADRAVYGNRSTERALEAVGRAGLPPDVQFEVQYRLLGGAGNAAVQRIHDALDPVYQLMQSEGLMDEYGQPRYLNDYRKFMRDVEVANLKGAGTRDASANIKTAAEARAGLDQLRTELGPQKFGVVERAHQMIQAARSQLLSDFVGAGVLSQDLADTLETNHPNYTRTLFEKYIDEGSQPPSAGGGDRATQSFNTLRRLAREGSTEDTETPMESMIRYFAEGEYTIRRNLAASAMIETMKADPAIGPWIEKAKTWRPATGPEVGGMKQPVATVMTPQFEARKGEIARLYDGKREFWRLQDNAPPHVRHAWSQLEDLAKSNDNVSAGIVGKIFGALNKPLRIGATAWSIPFQLRNAIRDATMLWVRHGFAGMANLPQGYWSALTQDALWRDAMRAGMGFEGMFNRTPRDVEEAIRSGGGILVKDPNALRALAKTVWRNEFGLKPVGRMIEGGPRLAAYQRLIKGGLTREEAALEGRSVTVDWHRAGQTMRAINPVVLFANARMQGMLNMGRTLRDVPGAKYRAGALAALAIGAYAWNRQQQGYQDVPDYVKDGHLVLVLPGATPKADGVGYDNLHYLAFPLGEWAAFTAPVHMLLQHLDGSDEGTTGMLDAIGREIGVASLRGTAFSDSPEAAIGTLFPAPLRTPMELADNKRWFSSTPVVPHSLQNLPPQEQISPSTSAASVWATNLASRLGQNWSPVALDFAVKENLGGLGSMLLGMSDALAGKAPDTVPVVGSITSGILRSYGGQQENDRFNLAAKLQGELEQAAIDAVKAQPGYQSATPAQQHDLLAAAQQELVRATREQAGIQPPAPSDRGLPPKYRGVQDLATQQEIDHAITAVGNYQRDPTNSPFPTRQQLDLWAAHHGQVNASYTAARAQQSQDTHAATGAVASLTGQQQLDKAATGPDADSLRRASLARAQIQALPQYVDPRTGSAIGTPDLWQQWDQWLARYNALPDKDPRAPYRLNPMKVQLRPYAVQLLEMQNQDRLKAELADQDYQRYFGIGKGLTDQAWAQIQSTPKYRDLQPNDAQNAARDAFLATYRKIPVGDPRRVRFAPIARRYQSLLNKQYAAIVPTDRFLQTYGVSDLSSQAPAA